jgi:hypothetical protein
MEMNAILLRRRLRCHAASDAWSVVARDRDAVRGWAKWGFCSWRLLSEIGPGKTREIICGLEAGKGRNQVVSR